MKNDAAKQVVTGFFKRWNGGFDEMLRAFYDTMTPGCIWKNSGFPDAVGPAQCAALLGQLREALKVAKIEVTITNLVGEGPLVVTERRDDIMLADGKVVASMDVLGIFEIVDGRIAAWREYADPGEVAKAMGI
jgi:limonene-1,2-epoxide hydrolase